MRHAIAHRKYTHHAWHKHYHRKGRIDWFNFALGWVWACALSATMLLYSAQKYDVLTKKNLISPEVLIKAERIQRVDYQDHFTIGKITKEPAPTKTPVKPAYIAPHNEITSYIDSVFGQFSDRAKAIIQCESGFNVNARNVNRDLSVDRGLWQLNSIHKDITPACAYDFHCATDAAYRLFQAQGFRPWVCNTKV